MQLRRQAATRSSGRPPVPPLKCAAVPPGIAAVEPMHTHQRAFCFDLHTVVNMDALTTECAWAAAKQLWPEAVVASPGVFQRHMAQVSISERSMRAQRAPPLHAGACAHVCMLDSTRQQRLYQVPGWLVQVLPALGTPHEAVLLIRLLVDEGIVGARSTAGRPGPVVGRPVRQSGSRCNGGHAVPNTASPWHRLAASLASVPAALPSVHHGWCLPLRPLLRPLLIAELIEHWDMIRGTCLLRWSREAGQAGQPQQLSDAVQAAFAAAQLQRMAGGGPATSPSSDGSCASGDDAATGTSASAAQPEAGTSTPPGAPCSALAGTSAYPAIVSAINTTQHRVYISSSHPHALALAALRGAGVTITHPAAVIQAASPAAVVAGVLQQAGEDLAELHFVLDRPASAEGLLCAWLAEARSSAVNAQLLVGEWACSAPSLRARVMSHATAVASSGSAGGRSASSSASDGSLGLVSEHALAEAMSVAQQDLVMDGIAWR